MVRLISVTSQATLVARVITFVAFVVGMAVNFGWIPVETADAINAWMQGEVAAQIIVGVSMVLTAVLPSFVGWMSKDKELPDGVDIKDVQVADGTTNPVQKSVALQQAQAKVAKIVVFALFAGLCAAGVTACTSTCSKTGSAPMTMAEQRAAGLCVYQPQ